MTYQTLFKTIYKYSNSEKDLCVSNIENAEKNFSKIYNVENQIRNKYSLLSFKISIIR